MNKFQLLSPERVSTNFTLNIGQLITTDAEILRWATDAGLSNNDHKMLLSEVKSYLNWKIALACKSGKIHLSKSLVKSMVEKTTIAIIEARHRVEQAAKKDALK